MAESIVWIAMECLRVAHKHGIANSVTACVGQNCYTQTIGDRPVRHITVEFTMADIDRNPKDVHRVLVERVRQQMPFYVLQAEAFYGARS